MNGASQPKLYMGTEDGGQTSSSVLLLKEKEARHAHINALLH